MGARITRKVDFKAIIGGGGGNDGILPGIKKAMGIAVSDAALEIVNRTQSGTDVNGNKFADYSPQYKKHRLDKGRSASPNLQFTGQMLAAIRNTVTQEDNKVIGRIDFNNETDRKKAEGNSRYRDFFGLSKEQVKKIKETIKQTIGGK